MQELLKWLTDNAIAIFGWGVTLSIALTALIKKTTIQDEERKDMQKQIVVLNKQQLDGMSRIGEIERILHTVVTDSGEHKRDLMEITTTMKELTVALNGLNGTLSKQIGEFRVIKDIVLKKK